MKKLILLWSTAALICSACNDNTPAPGVPTGDSAGKTTIPAPPQVDSAALTAKNDSLLMKEAITVLQLLKAKNFAALAGHVLRRPQVACCKGFVCFYIYKSIWR